MTQRSVPLLILWRYCLTEDDEVAMGLRCEAIRSGAVELDVARADRIRADLLRDQVQTIYSREGSA